MGGWRAGLLRGVVFGLLVLTGTGAQAQSDITYGGDARAFAMGGAGIALIQQQGGFRMNPATPAFEPPTVGFQFPSDVAFG